MNSAPKQALRPRTKLSQAELDEILRRHEMYLSARPGGQRALLAYSDLTGLNLTSKRLNDADLTACFLTEAKLMGANLTNATLFGANMTRADLRNAVLVRADLRGA